MRLTLNAGTAGCDPAALQRAMSRGLLFSNFIAFNADWQGNSSRTAAVVPRSGGRTAYNELKVLVFSERGISYSQSYSHQFYTAMESHVAL